MRRGFVTPVPTVYARPNPKHFGRRDGAARFNMINHQGRVLAGRPRPAPRDSPYVRDVLHDRDGGRRPEMIVTGTASYSGTASVQQGAGLDRGRGGPDRCFGHPSRGLTAFPRGRGGGG
ncbi:hypothetical protein GCM10023082_20110 [Streptomyces tremellae]|uniref:Tn3 transposase DDE domain-containing protein n=1 Tax=Streptomyces tremellae TaxID=1124239 RepID=A0ABP7EPR3_9ACTN